jgi:hypothetical protein
LLTFNPRAGCIIGKPSAVFSRPDCPGNGARSPKLGGATIGATFVTPLSPCAFVALYVFEDDGPGVDMGTHAGNTSNIKKLKNFTAQCIFITHPPKGIGV